MHTEQHAPRKLVEIKGGRPVTGTGTLWKGRSKDRGHLHVCYMTRQLTAFIFWFNIKHILHVIICVFIIYTGLFIFFLQ